MLIRVVKMTLRHEAIPEFVNMFNDRKQRIRHFPGCTHLELWQDKHNPEVFFTYSHWENEEALNLYRYSDFFKETWTITKCFFASKAEAYSINQVVVE